MALSWQGLYYLAAAFLLWLVVHKWLHSRWLFRHVHGVHHRSRNPSPWAAYTFHSIEAFISSPVTPLALMVVPLHGLVLLAFAIHQVLRNAHGHLSIETLPRGFARHWLRWAVYHDDAPPPAPRDRAGQLWLMVYVVGSVDGDGAGGLPCAV